MDHGITRGKIAWYFPPGRLGPNLILTNNKARTKGHVSDSIDASIDRCMTYIHEITQHRHHRGIDHPCKWINVKELSRGALEVLTYSETDSSIGDDQIVQTCGERDLNKFLASATNLESSDLTVNNDKPITMSPIIEANQRPILCPSGPKILVPIRYDMEAGRKAAPCSQLLAFMVSIIQRGSDGSKMAIPAFAKVRAPAATKIYGSLMRVSRLAPSWSSFVTFGCKTSNWRTETRNLYKDCRVNKMVILRPSIRAKNARIIKGDDFPTNS